MKRIVNNVLWIEFLILTQAFEIDIDNPLTGCPYDKLNATLHDTCCDNMNRIRRPFLQCCIYPSLVIPKWQWQIGIDQCKSKSVDGEGLYCCIQSWCFTYLKVIGTRPEVDGINPEGLIGSFMLSIGNDARWELVIRDSVNWAYNQFAQPIMNMTGITDPELIQAYEDFWNCFEQIPNYLGDIIEATYNRNFLQCPVFNSTLERCDLTRQYVQDCIPRVPNPQDYEDE